MLQQASRSERKAEKMPEHFENKRKTDRAAKVFMLRKSSRKLVLNHAANQAEKIAHEREMFTIWINHEFGCYESSMEGANFVVKDLNEDLKDGLVLLRLLQVLSKSSSKKSKHNFVPPHRKPKMDVHKFENIKRSFDILRSIPVKVVTVVNENDILQGDTKYVHELLWAMTREFVMDFEDGRFHGKLALQKKIQRWIAPYKGAVCKNLSTSWQDPRPYAALIDHFDPGFIDYEQLCQDLSNAGADVSKKTEIMQNMFGRIHMRYHVPPVMYAHVLMSQKKPNPKRIMLYVGKLTKHLQEYHAMSRVDRQLKKANVSKESAVNEAHDLLRKTLRTKTNAIGRVKLKKRAPLKKTKPELVVRKAARRMISKLQSRRKYRYLTFKLVPSTEEGVLPGSLDLLPRASAGWSKGYKDLCNFLSAKKPVKACFAVLDKQSAPVTGNTAFLIAWRPYNLPKNQRWVIDAVQKAVSGTTFIQANNLAELMHALGVHNEHEDESSDSDWDCDSDHDDNSRAAKQLTAAERRAAQTQRAQQDKANAKVHAEEAAAARRAEAERETARKTEEARRLVAQAEAQAREAAVQAETASRQHAQANAEHQKAARVHAAEQEAARKRGQASQKTEAARVQHAKAGAQAESAKLAAASARERAEQAKKRLAMAKAKMAEAKRAHVAQQEAARKKDKASGLLVTKCCQEALRRIGKTAHGNGLRAQFEEWSRATAKLLETGRLVSGLGETKSRDADVSAMRAEMLRVLTCLCAPYHLESQGHRTTAVEEAQKRVAKRHMGDLNEAQLAAFGGHAQYRNARQSAAAHNVSVAARGGAGVRGARQPSTGHATVAEKSNLELARKQYAEQRRSVESTFGGGKPPPPPVPGGSTSDAGGVNMGSWEGKLNEHDPRRRKSRDAHKAHVAYRRKMLAQRRAEHDRLHPHAPPPPPQHQRKSEWMDPDTGRRIGR